MLEPTQPDSSFDPEGRHAALRVLGVTLRIGAQLLGSGESTNDLESMMQGLAQAAGLAGIEPTVLSGLVTVSWDPSLHGEPITMMRVVRQRTTEYDRLADLASIVRARDPPSDQRVGGRVNRAVWRRYR
jgi:uncharacterized membrane protein YjjP (DUF1212 family)